MSDPNVGVFKIEFKDGAYRLYRWSEKGQGIYDPDKPVDMYTMPHRYEPGWLELEKYTTLFTAEAKPRFYTADGEFIQE